MPANFTELSLKPALLSNLPTLGYDVMTPVQDQSLPLILKGHDLIAQAKTGSGKTAAFGLGLLNQIDFDDLRIQALVLCPTRELADQVAKELRRLAQKIPNVKIVTLCGGTPAAPQRASLAFGAHIAVGTPGRIEDLVRCKALSLRTVAMLVLDEADRMLDMGFSEPIRRIISLLPTNRQTLLFSATFPDLILSMSRSLQRDPIKVVINDEADRASVDQIFYDVAKDEKQEALKVILRHHAPTSALIFCTTKERCRDVAEDLKRDGFVATALHGDLEQRDREKVLVHFSNLSCPILVATDVAARGLDIKDMPLVVNFDVSVSPEVHIHRIGRTGRAGAQGLAVSLISSAESRKLDMIQEKMAMSLQTVPWKDLSLSSVPKPKMTTLQIGSGKKNKLRPADILGALTGGSGIPGSKIGKINVFDFQSYVAVDSSIAKQALKHLSSTKIKGRQINSRFSSF